MPSASDSLAPDLDSTPGTTPPNNQGLHPSTASTAKKKKKSKKNGRQQKPWDDASEDTPYPKSITPSPPTDHLSGVRLSAEPTPPNSEPEGVKDDEDAAMAAWEQTPPQPPAELELEQETEIPQPELLIQDFGDLDAHLDEPEPEIRPPSPKPLPSPAPMSSVSSPLSSPRPRKATPATVQAPPAPVPSVKRTAPPRIPSQDKDTRPPVAERRRTDSITQPASPVPRKSFVEPVNPPHMKQNHYFAVPGLDFGLGAAKGEKGGKQAGSEHYCCCFDSFSNAGDSASATRARDALIVGWEGGLEVYRVLADKMEIVGRLEGLRGGVVGAKILPWSHSSGSNPSLLPLVALVIHGPMIESARSLAQEDTSDGEDTAKHYQTTVEVFSLHTQKHVSTLYKSLPVALPEAKLGAFATVPEPVGDLRLDAKGSFLTISSGKSGEIFVFAQRREGAGTSGFRCIGKYWTSLQSRFDVQPKPNASTEHVLGGDVQEPQTSPLLSLSGRWLAIVPPSSSSKISVQGTLALLEDYQQPPGVGSHLAPPQPLVSCDIVGLNAEGVLAKYSRQAAQEFLKASRRGIEMGMAGWREFTQPSPPSRPSQRTEGGDEVFPPTNAPGDDARRVTKEPAVVAIMDLDRLLDAEENHAKHLPPPLASFALEDGCNYLSLSADGLRLLTTSRKGEVSNIWDLRYAAHGSSQRRDVDNGDVVMGPHVNRVQRIVRNSHAVVLDTAWARDGNFVAILTAHGTVHLHEISSRAQDSQKRRRKSTITAAPVDKADATVSLSTGLSPPSSNGFLGGIRSGWQTMSTQVSAMRAPNPASTESRAAFGIPTTFAGFREVTNAGAAASGRAIARGLSQGYSAARIGAADVWHADDNKIKHKDAPNNVAARTVRWIKTRGGMSIAVTCGGKVFLYPIQRVTRQRGETTFSGLKVESKGRREFGLPPIVTTSAAAQSNKSSVCAKQGPHGFWGLRAPAYTQKNNFDMSGKKVQDSESDKAHYETNPPFCPLYIDRRVSMLGFNSSSHGYSSTHNLSVSEFQLQGHGLEDEQPWLFGTSIPSSVKLNDRSAASDPSMSDDEDLAHHQDHAMSTFEAELDGGHADGGGSGSHGDGNVQSRILINPANNEIRINSSRRKPRKLLASPKAPSAKSASGNKADGDFDLLEDDEE